MYKKIHCANSRAVILYIISTPICIRVRGSTRPTVHYCAEESPPTIQVTQPYASTGGESHSSGTETIHLWRSNEAENAER